MLVSLRLKDDRLSQIDARAQAAGKTRSKWLADLIDRELGEGESDIAPVEKRDGPRTRIELRLTTREVAAVEKIAEPLGLTAAKWVILLLRWQLFDRANELKLAPATKRELEKISAQIVRIGRNVNQAVHAMNAAAMPGSALRIDRVAAQLLDMQTTMRDMIVQAERDIIRLVSADVRYWRAFSEAERG